MHTHEYFVETEQDLDEIKELAVNALWAEDPISRPATETYDIYVRVFEYDRWEAIILSKGPGIPHAVIVDDSGAMSVIDIRTIRGVE